LGECGKFAELGELKLNLAGNLLVGLDLSGRSYSGYGEPDGNRGSDALVEKIGF
jgi:hypothetical protein